MLKMLSFGMNNCPEMFVPPVPCVTDDTSSQAVPDLYRFSSLTS